MAVVGEPAVDSQALLLLAAYSVGILATSLLGGWLPNRAQITHARLQMVLSFVAGLILGVAAYHLLPHALAQISGHEAVETAVWWMMAGMLVTLMLLFFLDFHEHDFSDEHKRLHDRAGRSSGSGGTVSWLGIVLGLSVHALTEGITLGSTLRLAHHGEAGLAGFGVFLAIALHKPLDALSVVTTMKIKGLGQWPQRAANVTFALICPVAAFATYWGAAQFGPSETLVIGCALAFAAGSFLCIALSDLLPEIHFHSHDRIKLATCFLTGVGIAYAMHWVEPSELHGSLERQAKAEPAQHLEIAMRLADAPLPH